MNIAWQGLPSRAAEALVSWSTRRHRTLLVATALLTLATAWFTATHITIDTDTGNMLDGELPHRQAARALDAAFPRLPGDVVIYAEAAHVGAAEAAADALAARLRERGDIARAVYQPGGGAYFRRNGLLFLEQDALWDLADRLTAAEPLLGVLAADPSLRGLFNALAAALGRELDAAQQALLADLLARVTRVLNRADGAAMRWREELFPAAPHGGPARAFVLIDPALSEASFRPADAAIAALEGEVAALATLHPEVDFQLTGAEIMDGEELVTVAADAKLTTTLAFVGVAIVLVWGLRSPRLVVAVLITLACGLVWTAAFAVAAIGSLNIISVSFAVLFIGMGVDFGIQYVLRYREELARTADTAPALAAAARGAGGALTLAAVGAAISFFAFVPTDYRGLAQLGVISGSSMGIALLANLSVLPALLALFGRPRALPVPAAAAASTGTLGRFVQRYRRAVLVVTALAVVASVGLLPRVRFDLNPLNLKNPDTPAVRAFRALAANESPYFIEILAADLDQAQARARALSALPEVERVVTLTSYLPVEQDEKLEIIEAMRLASGALMAPAAASAPTPAQEIAAVATLSTALAAAQARHAGSRLAEQAAALAQTLDQLRAAPDWATARLPQVGTRLLGDLPATLARLRDLLEAGPVSVADLPPDLRSRYLAADGRARIEVYPTAALDHNEHMRRFARAVQALEPAATGAPIELVEGSVTVIRACTQAALSALLLTLLMHVVVLRGVWDAVLVAAPLVVAMLLTLATSVLGEFQLNFANIIALPLLIGLNNAYGAYLVMRRGSGQDIGSLLATSTPRAVLFSGMTTIASFGTLGFSQHPGMAGMGILISFSLVYALACALLVLPALMLFRGAVR